MLSIKELPSLLFLVTSLRERAISLVYLTRKIMIFLVPTLIVYYFIKIEGNLIFCKIVVSKNYLSIRFKVIILLSKNITRVKI